MIGQIYKIDQLKQSRNKGEVFYRVYFNMKGAMDDHYFWAKTDIVPNFRNYSRWKGLLEVGNVITGLKMRRPEEVDADSSPKLLGNKPVVKKPDEKDQQEEEKPSPQMSFL